MDAYIHSYKKELNFTVCWNWCLLILLSSNTTVLWNQHQCAITLFGYCRVKLINLKRNMSRWHLVTWGSPSLLSVWKLQIVSYGYSSLSQLGWDSGICRVLGSQIREHGFESWSRRAPILSMSSSHQYQLYKNRPRYTRWSIDSGPLVMRHLIPWTQSPEHSNSTLARISSSGVKSIKIETIE